MTPFQYLAVDGNLEALRARYRRRLCREAPSLSRRERMSWIDERVDFAVQLFADGPAIEPSELARAINRPIAYLRRANWRPGHTGNRRRRAWHPYAGSMGQRGDNPAKIAEVSEGDAEATQAIIGSSGREIPGDAVAVAGGMVYMENEGKMVPTVRVVREWVVNIATPQGPSREERFEIDCGWRMKRTTAHKATDFEPCTVRDSVTVIDRHAGHQPPPPPADWTGLVCVVTRGETHRARLSHG